MKVLLVDDDDDQLNIRSLLLSHHGFEVIAASDGATAVELGVTNRPQAAVVDIRLPGEEDGLSLICRLKAELPEIAILAFTGADPGRLKEREEYGLIDEWLVKGASIKSLIAKLKVLAARRAA